MPEEKDTAFLRTAVEAGALDPAVAEEVRAAIAQVAELGGTSSAEEIVRNRGLLTDFQIEKVLEACAGDGAAADAKPSRIGAFEVLEPLSESGRSVVYHARQPAMGREVALKVLKPEAARDPAAVRAFQAEGRALSTIVHANVVQGFEVAEADGRHYFSMELIDGETLRDRLRRAGPLSEPEALAVARQVGLALIEAEKAGLLHGNIKPSNILLTRKGSAKLAALGLAKCSRIAGTPLYMSPERARGGDPDVRSDLYSLGATLYHAVVGEPPFQGSDAKGVMRQHVTAPVPSARKAVPALSEGFSRLLATLMAKDPAERPASAAALVEAVDQVRQGVSGPTSPAAAAAAAVAAARARSASRSRQNDDDRRARGRRPQQPASAATTIWIIVGAVAVLVLLVLLMLPGGGGDKQEQKPTKVVTRKKEAPQDEEEAQKELRRIERYIEGGKRDPERLLRLYKAVAGRFPSTKGAATARAEMARIQREIDAELTRELNAAVARANALAEELKFTQAIGLLREFGAKHPNAFNRAGDAEANIYSRIHREERTRREKARALAEQGDYDGAIALYREIIAFGVPQLTGKAKFDISALEKKRDEARDKARKGAGATWESLQKQRIALLSERRYDEARQALQALLDEPEMESIHERVKAEMADLAAIETVWSAAGAAAKGLKPGEVLPVGGIRGAFVNCKDGQITVQASDVAVTKPLRELPAAEVLALADRVLAADDAAAQFARGLFLLAEGECDLAGKAFVAGQNAGGDAKPYWACLDRWKADGLEAKAEAALAELRKLAEGQKWGELDEAIAAYTEKFGKTRTATAHRDVVAALALESRLASLSVADLFAGACRAVSNGRKVEVTYDFASVEQLADWSLGGASWDLKDGVLALRGARAYLAAPTLQEGAVTLQVADGGGAGAWGVALGSAAANGTVYEAHLPEQAGLPATITDSRVEVGQGATSFGAGQTRKVSFALRGKRLGLGVDGRTVATGATRNGAATRLNVLLTAAPTRTMRVSGLRVCLTLPDAWVAEQTALVRAVLQRRGALAARPWQPMLNGHVLDPWNSLAGDWTIENGVAAVRPTGSLALGDARTPVTHGDFEWQVSVQPAHVSSVVRLRFRSGQVGGYALSLGGPASCALLALGPKLPREGEALARFGSRVDWQADQWYDLRVLAAGQELRVECGGALLCVVRDGRWASGSLALDVVQGGAAFRGTRLRFLD